MLICPGIWNRGEIRDIESEIYGGRDSINFPFPLLGIGLKFQALQLEAFP
jgi:hypothetical protein